MSRSSRPGMNDVRAVFRLLQEVRDLRHDRAAWQRHAITRLCAMLDARQGTCLHIEHFVPGGTLRLLSAIHAGWSNATAAALWEAQLAGSPDLSGDVQLARAVELPGDVVAVLREQLVSDAEYYGSQLVQELMPVTEIDGHLSAWCRLGGADDVIALAFHRDWKAARATRRQRGVLQLFMEELHLMWREGQFNFVPLISEPRLSPRERQVLERLAAGDSVKQAAAFLGLSHRTVEGHIKSLHRKFAVNSRGELLARCFGRAPCA